MFVNFRGGIEARPFCSQLVQEVHFRVSAMTRERSSSIRVCISVFNYGCAIYARKLTSLVCLLLVYNCPLFIRVFMLKYRLLSVTTSAISVHNYQIHFLLVFLTTDEFLMIYDEFDVGFDLIEFTWSFISSRDLWFRIESICVRSTMLFLLIFVCFFVCAHLTSFDSGNHITGYI